jgi:signal recognition particle subunit SRP54
MTKSERRNVDIINGSRRRRIADGSGTLVQDVNRLLKSYVEARKAMRMMMGGGSATKKKGKKRRMKAFFPF